jgi:para-aminobenzoate synthetase component 1
VSRILELRERTGLPEPAELFAALSGRRGAFLLDSALLGAGDGGTARWSFFGSEPFLVLAARGTEVRLEGYSPEDGPSSPRAIRTWRGDPLRALARQLEELGFAGRPDSVPEDVPAPFSGGAVGFFGYDLKHRIENLPEPAHTRETDDLHISFHAAIAAYDHLERRLWLLSRGLGAGSAAGARSALDRLEKRIDQALDATRRGLHRPPRGTATAALRQPCEEPSPGPGWRCSFTPAAYRAAVARLIELIAAGEIYQANLSQRFETPLRAKPWALYRALRDACPAPYAAFMRCGDLEILSASPERFLLRRGDRIETRPIKGTRPRGRTSGEDRRLAEELLRSEKDRAELVMIVDVERNDLGRVCRTGSVEVPELARLESYANVHHLVATVRGRLKAGVGPVELLEATFPGGSITGAPKIRAMEILDGIEPTRRGPYTGAAGYIDVSGDLDLQIAIRTAYSLRGRAWFQVGGGIVSDSDPQAEYEETLAKGKALAAVLGPTMQPGAREGPVTWAPRPPRPEEVV